jgi:4'-phosphopantetheinyl transferase EntD
LSISSQSAAIGERRQPLWPVSIIGKISHAHKIAICFLSNNRQQVIGVDAMNVLQHFFAQEIDESIVSREEAALNPILI